MQATFLLGPAGSGKTHRCLAEIRSELRKSPEGLPLVLLAPKQATFQLERQLLADPSLPGYTRLQILSFERLGELVLAEFRQPAPRLLDEEGRVMVLRALLAQKQKELKVFRASARLPGFAQQLSLLLRELQRHHKSPEKLSALAAESGLPTPLADKLHDFALLLRTYLDWLKGHQLEDVNCLLDLATATLRSQSAPGDRSSAIRFGGLWLDGFAEMTPQELDFLAALMPFCDRATLAFCLEGEPKQDWPWLSTWSVVAQSFRNCHQRLVSLRECSVAVETLKRAADRGRFAGNPALARLEEHWAGLRPFEDRPKVAAHENSRPVSSALEKTLRVAICSNPGAEAVLAAREILRHVRSGGRYRDCAVLVRTLDGYHDVLRRTFLRYEIPVFLDRREAVAHHPLAELTRYAVRIAAFGWEHDDWFGALKTGLAPVEEAEIDLLENEALAHGWKNDAWKLPVNISTDESLARRLERLRQKIVPPFLDLVNRLAAPGFRAQTGPTGAELAAALGGLWKQLGVDAILERWSAAQSQHPRLAAGPSTIHSTVWEQMQSWLDNLAMAFPDDPLPLREWLPIMEAGLANVTVGVIPPALDHVLVGAIDRSRNPELKLVIVLGLNESVFPAAPEVAGLLTESDREQLEAKGIQLGPDKRAQLGHERYYGYVALTRARQRLVLSCARSDPRGRKLNRSSLLDDLVRLFPQLSIEDWQPPDGFGDVQHFNEIVAPAVRLRNTKPAVQAEQLFALPGLGQILTRAVQVRNAGANRPLTPALAEALHGRELVTSLTALEDFAACPFKFFVGRGLRAEERRKFELDARERGSFQHEVLSAFHRRLAVEGRKWRNVSSGEARLLVRDIGRELLPDYHDGLFFADRTRRFTGEVLLESLETLIEVLVGWARDYQFDPECVEAGFGLPGATWPAWRLSLDGGRDLLLRGRMDRVDAWRDPATGTALVVVMDYKASGRKPDQLKLHHGLELQLPAYLAVLEHLPEASVTFRATRLVPAGAFYVNLRGEFTSKRSRTEALDDPARALRESFQHSGRYDESFLEKLDPAGKAEQFKTHPRSYDRMGSQAFRSLLDRTVQNLRRFGEEIFAGRIEPEPYRKGSEIACGQCDYRAVCRFDPWTEPFRQLSRPSAVTTPPGSNRTKKPPEHR